MSASTGERMAPRRQSPLDPIRFAEHIRGHVTGPVHCVRNRKPIWRVEVIHVPSGRVLNSDDAFTLADAVADATGRTHIAQLAWFYGFAKKGMGK
jgi:hypothetical protein